MENANACYLTTIDEEGFPTTRAMLNLRNKKQFPKLINLFNNHKEDFLIYFSTNTSSRKVAQIKANPKACVYFCDTKAHKGFRLLGIMQIVTDMEEKKALWHDWWKIYQFDYNDPDYSVLRLFPAFLEYYYQLENYRFDLKDKK